MDRLRLLPMDLPTITVSTIGNTKSKSSFVRRLTVGFVILAVLGLLYVPAYHSAQSPFLGETPSPAESPGSLHSLASVAQLPGWSYNTSRDLCVYIHPGNTTSILSPTGICSLPPYLLIIVCSAVANQEARTAIRSTWANKYNLDNLYNFTVKVAFLLGQSDNDTLNNLIVEESSQYNDIVQERFLDTYNNLTLKSVMMLKWVMSNCDQTKYLMKTDDDMFVNIPLLLQTLHSKPKTETLLGSLICNARPILDPKNKWYMPKYMYSEKTYPNYLSGTGYVMSMGVASKLYQAALVTPLLHLEDVYITGLCAKRAKVRPVNHPGFGYGPRKMDPCVLRNAITTHKVNASNMYVIWIKVNNASVICNNRTRVDRKSITLSRSSRNAGYYVFKKKTINRVATHLDGWSI
ncbi:beta-1,3-galactosyltransferase 1-like isoform X2 [Pseudomyrmex gracilis]|uniref:beta-1,3-galactosyltransferase 1-like isoform X2 n=1 Tax=Pseudomyrmex gracilis TaxID=219809 RepID=UPI000994F232|nr:beta-1,3-galactosyltransferase 1-like isoform X2 [Pseudomyrmex gracilis]